MLRAKHLLTLSICSLSIFPAAPGAQTKRPVTVADAICMTKLGNPSYEPAQFSPDGQKFVIVLKKGNLDQNTNDYSLVLWHTNEVFHNAKPQALVTLSSSSNRPAIKDIRWLDDNKTLFFLGEHPGELQQIYSFNVSEHALRRLTNSKTNIVSYAVSARGERVLYAAEQHDTALFDEKAEREGLVVSRLSISDLVSGHKNVSNATFKGEVEFFLQTGEEPSQRVHDTPASLVQFYRPVMSPDGRFVVVLGVVDRIPPGWNDYTDPQIRWWTQHERTPPKSGQRMFLLQPFLLATATGQVSPLLDAPTSTSSTTEVAWSPDSRSVVITNTYLPLNHADASEREARVATQISAVEVSVPRGEITKITNESVNSPEWSNTNRLGFRTGKSKWEHATMKVDFEKNGGHWTRVREEPVEQTRPNIRQEEDLNKPPKVVAIHPKTQQKAALLDLNPQFADLQFANEEAIEWKGSDGHEVKGGLYYPVGYRPGERYPLVIQTHAFSGDRFWIDGPFTTAFAAQPLAGRGLMVLQMDEDYSDSDTPKEVDREVAGLEGAIDYLDQQGLIDRSRVGVIGFSRPCLHVKFALTHSKYHFAAASVTDGVDNGYFQYVMGSGSTGFEEALEGSNGGLPFGEGLKSWMRRSPGFNVDKVSTPLLIFAPNPLSALFQWEWYAALKRLGKPVEMVVLADGEHELQKPWDRRVSLQQNVDWFCFWLKGEEDADPGKAGQHGRWRELRRLQPDNSKHTARKATQP